MNTEPAVIVSLIGAVLALAASFGLDLTEDQTRAIMALALILAGIATRRYVTPAARADARAQAAYEDVQVEGHPGNPFGGQ